jgi:hypothetical protein
MIARLGQREDFSKKHTAWKISRSAPWLFVDILPRVYNPTTAFSKLQRKKQIPDIFRVS